jgi:dinuclear metal center YbgI/SA1388 family protein
MTTSRDEIAGYLREMLKPESFKDHCTNGIQVYGREDVRKVATCASVSEEFFASARKAGADLLLVHHGLFWDNSSRVIDPLMGRRLQILLEGGLNLLAYHLCLDAHPRLGNNARLAALLNLQDLDFSFGQYHGSPLGCVGNLPTPMLLTQVAETFSQALDPRAAPAVFEGLNPEVSRVGVISGGAGDIPHLLEARESGCDTFVTGVMFEQSVSIAREARLNVIALGHYNSEKLGVIAIGDALASKFAIEAIHLDVPNPV